MHSSIYRCYVSGLASVFVVALAVGSGCSAQSQTSPDGDLDGDHIVDGQDNCPETSNEDQADQDDDGVGDACDSAPNDPNSGQQPDSGGSSGGGGDSGGSGSSDDGTSDGDNGGSEDSGGAPFVTAVPMTQTTGLEFDQVLVCGEDSDFLGTAEGSASGSGTAGVFPTSIAFEVQAEPGTDSLAAVECVVGVKFRTLADTATSAETGDGEINCEFRSIPVDSSGPLNGHNVFISYSLVRLDGDKSIPVGDPVMQGYCTNPAGCPWFADLGPFTGDVKAQDLGSITASFEPDAEYFLTFTTAANIFSSSQDPTLGGAISGEVRIDPEKDRGCRIKFLTDDAFDED